MPSAVVVGDWHLASVTAAGLLDLGYRVGAWDFDDDARAALAAAEGTAAEPGVADRIRRAHSTGAYRVIRDADHLREMLRTADLALVAYDSRTTADGDLDDDRPRQAAEFLLTSGPGRPPIIVSSQVRAGTCDMVLASTGEPRDSPALIHIPENLRLGRALHDFRRPQRLVIGCNAGELPDAVRRLVRQLDPGTLIQLTMVEAEFVKHGTNTFLAACVVFANDLGWVARNLGADPFRVLAGVQADHRIGNDAPLRPGEAYAGATLQRDVRALQQAGEAWGRDGLFAAISLANSVHALEPVAQLDRILDGLDGRRICLLGLTYKANMSAVRDSPAVRLASELTAHGCTVSAFDPVAEPADFRCIMRFESAEKAVAGADCTAVLTAHDVFRAIDFTALQPRRRLMLDLCGGTAEMLNATSWQVFDRWR